MKKINFLFTLLLVCFAGLAQVTTSSISGVVKSPDGKTLSAAGITAKNIASGSAYKNATREDGRFNLSGLRVGGPYTITITFVGFEPYVEENIFMMKILVLMR